MCRVLLLCNLCDPTADDVRRAPKFLKLAAPKTCDVYKTDFSKLIIRVGEGKFSIFDTKNKMDLKEFDTVFIRGSQKFDMVRDAALAVGYYGRKHGFKVVNDIEYALQSKLAHAVRFEWLKIPVLETIWLSKAVLNDKEVASSLGFPCIMKDTFGSLGKCNYKVKSYAEIKRHQKENPDKYFVLQRYIESDGDYRLLMIGKERLLISYPTHTNKTYEQIATDGTGSKTCKLSVLPRRALHDAKKISKYLHMTLSGADILTCGKKYYFLEVNAQPNLTNLDDPVKDKIAIFKRFFNKNK